MREFLLSLLGPQLTAEEFRAHPVRYLLPNVLLLLAAVVLLCSLFVPYWEMTLHAPQYPAGLHLHAYLNHLDGDVEEIDGLNHYIGMRPLGEAAQLERELSIMAVAVMTLLVLAGMFVRTPLALPLALPAVIFPAMFLIDLHYWMSHFGQNLNPRAPLSQAIKPFVPPVLGTGTVGQFHTVARPDTGLWLAIAASGLVVFALWAHRRAYKPLLEQYRWVRTTPKTAAKPIAAASEASQTKPKEGPA